MGKDKNLLGTTAFFIVGKRWADAADRTGWNRGRLTRFASSPSKPSASATAGRKRLLRNAEPPRLGMGVFSVATATLQKSINGARSLAEAFAPRKQLNPSQIENVGGADRAASRKRE